MGACLLYKTFPGTLTASQLRAEFTDLYHKDRVEYGTDPYSGSWATISSLNVFPDSTYESVEEAIDKLDEMTGKRTASAARAKSVRTSFVSPTTFGGKVYSTSGRPLWTPPDRHGGKECYADQLTPDEQVKLSSLRGDWTAADRALRAASSLVDGMVQDILHSISPFASGEVEFKTWETLRKEYESAFDAHVRYKEINASFEAYCLELRDRLYQTKVEDKGPVWVIVGLAAE